MVKSFFKITLCLLVLCCSMVFAGDFDWSRTQRRPNAQVIRQQPVKENDGRKTKPQKKKKVRRSKKKKSDSKKKRRKRRSGHWTRDGFVYTHTHWGWRPGEKEEEEEWEWEEEEEEGEGDDDFVRMETPSLPEE